MDEAHLQEIRRLYNLLRGRLPAADEVRVRPNRRRALSLTHPDGRVRLNVARAVVDAGPEAWRLVAPTLRKDALARRRFRELVAPHLPSGEAREPAGASPATGDGTRPRVRPTRPAACQGTGHERRVLETLWAWARERFQGSVPFPAPVRLRVSRRMRRAYGNAAWKGDRYELTLGAQLFRRGCESILLDTFLHELAHLVDLAHRGRTDHGPAWRQWAQRLGAEPTRLLSRHAVDHVASAARGAPCGLPEPVGRWSRSR